VPAAQGGSQMTRLCRQQHSACYQRRASHLHGSVWPAPALKRVPGNHGHVRALLSGVRGPLLRAPCGVLRADVRPDQPSAPTNRVRDVPRNAVSVHARGFGGRPAGAQVRGRSGFDRRGGRVDPPAAAAPGCGAAADQSHNRFPASTPCQAAGTCAATGRCSCSWWRSPACYMVVPVAPAHQLRAQPHQRPRRAPPPLRDSEFVQAL